MANPAFDPHAFQVTAFQTAEEIVPTAPQQTFEVGDRVGSEWYACQRCDRNYPRAKVLVQNGLIVCHGPNTLNCYDERGHDAYMSDLRVPREKPIPPLPSRVEKL